MAGRKEKIVVQKLCQGIKKSLLCKEHYFPLIYFSVIVVFFFSPFLFSGAHYVPLQGLRSDPLLGMENAPELDNIELGDIPALVYPAWHAWNTMLHKGHLTFWNPDLLSGCPFMATGGVPYFYLPALIAHFLWSTTTAHALLLIFHLFAAGLGMYVLARNYGLPLISSLMAGTAWMLAGQQTTWLEYGHMSVIYACTPWVFLFFRRSLQFDSYRQAAAGGFFLGLAFLGGTIQLNYYLLLLLFAYSCYRAAFCRTKIIRTAVSLSVMGLIAFCLTAPQLLSQMELAGLSQRLTFSFQELHDTYSAPLYSYLIRLIVPDIFGNPAMGFHLFTRGITFYQEICIYGGIITLLVALMAGRSPQKEKWFFAVLCVVTLLFAACTPVFWPFYKFLPVLNKVLPGRIVFIFLFSLSLLAGFGTAEVEKGTYDRRLLLILTAFCVFCFFLFFCGCTYLQSHTEKLVPSLSALLPRAHFDPVIPGSSGKSTYAMSFIYHMVAFYDPINYRIFTGGVLCLLVLCLFYLEGKKYIRGHFLLYILLVLSAVDLTAFGMRYNPVCRQKGLQTSAVISTLKQRIGDEPGRILRLDSAKFPNVASVFGLQDIEGCNGLYPASYAEVMSALESRFNGRNRILFGNAVRMTSYRAPLLDMLNLRFIISHPDPLPPDEDLHSLGLIDGCHVYEKKTWCRRFFMVHRVACEKPERINEIILSPYFRPEEIAFLEKDPVYSGKAGEQGNGAVRILSLSPDSAHIEVSAGRKGIVVFSDIYYPGWRVEVDGTPAGLLRVNGLLKGVAVNAGTHRILFSYRPTYLGAGLVLHGAALAAGAFIVISFWIQKRRRDGISAEENRAV